MLIIGEKFNSSIPFVKKAMQSGDKDRLAHLAARQVDAGADYLDLNTAVFLQDEVPKMREVLEIILEAAPSARVMIDTPNPAAAAQIFSEYELKDAILNSITLESNRFDAMAPLVKEKGVGVVALPISDEGIPQDTDSFLRLAGQLISRLTGAGVAFDKIYLDLLFQTVSSDHLAAARILESQCRLKREFPGIKTIGGLSNISFGLPLRSRLNAAFLICCLEGGMDAAILDPTNEDIRLALAAYRLIKGKDDYCMDYITLYRELEEEEA